METSFEGMLYMISYSCTNLKSAISFGPDAWALMMYAIFRTSQPIALFIYWIFNSILSRLSDPYNTPPPSSTHPSPSQEHPTSQSPSSTHQRHQTSSQTPDYHTSHKVSSHTPYKRSFSQGTPNPHLSNVSSTCPRPSQ